MAITEGQPITYRDGEYDVPSRPIIPFIEGDGTGPDIWRAARKVFDAAVARAGAGREALETPGMAAGAAGAAGTPGADGGRRVVWREVLAGEKAFRETGSWLPEDTLAAIREFRVGIKGPLTTPIGGGIRSLNVALRQILDLYACIRPVRYFRGVPSPMKSPEDLDVVIFRENTEDVYAGIEYAAGSAEAKRLREFLTEQFGARIREGSAIGIKPMSEVGTKRLVAMAIGYALRKGRPSLTLVHKGNIMKYTEGAFRDWGYQVARERFADRTVPEAEAGGVRPGDRLVIRDRIADSMFQQLLLRPKEYSVLATPNLNGDYLSDACAAQVGGLGMAPGANVGDGYAVFEATHGTAPKYAGQDKVNPGSLILSGVMLFEHLGWDDVAASIVRGLEGAIAGQRVTYDLARQMPGATCVPTSAFAEEIIARL